MNTVHIEAQPMTCSQVLRMVFLQNVLVQPSFHTIN